MLLLGLALIGFSGQALANAPCQPIAADAPDFRAMSDCPDMKASGSDDENKKEAPCGDDDCALMLQCTYSPATAGFRSQMVDRIAMVSPDHVFGHQYAPMEHKAIPEIKPPKPSIA